MPEQPIYDLNRTLEENIAAGPPRLPDDLEIPEVPQVEWMGHTLNSKFGVAASPLTMSPGWVKWLGRLSYDLITYKTVRSREWGVHPAPNWTYVYPDSLQEGEITAGFEPTSDGAISMANSFGVQSPPPEVWIPEFAQAAATLSPGQKLILSVMPSITPDIDIMNDVAALAAAINQTNASIIEVNLACPNSDHNLIYRDVEQSMQIMQFLRRNLPNRQLFAKIGLFPSLAELTNFFMATTPFLDGITSMNTMSMTVVQRGGQPMFPGRPNAGISGEIIRPYAMQQMQSLVQLCRDTSRGNLGLIAVGGVNTTKHIADYMNLAESIVVQAVTGVWENRFLGIQHKQQSSLK